MRCTAPAVDGVPAEGTGVVVVCVGRHGVRGHEDKGRRGWAYVRRFEVRGGYNVHSLLAIFRGTMRGP